MILSILKPYSTLLLSIGMSSLLLFVLGLYFILRKPASKPVACATATMPLATTPADLQNLTAIAGEDVLTTQLDLARAYIEAGRKQLAASILESVIKQGTAEQQQEAQQLMNYR